MPANKGKGKKGKKGSGGKNSSKKSKKNKEVRISRESKEIDDDGQSSYVDEENPKIVDSKKALSNKERRKLKKEKRKEEKQSTQSAGSPDESNETPNITAEQSNNNSEINLPSDKDNSDQHLVNDDTLSSAGEKSSISDQPGQQGSNDDKKDVKRENSGAGEKSNDVNSKKTSSSSSAPPSLDNILSKLNKTLISVSDNNISPMLREVHKLEFTLLNQQEVERCIQWIIESASDRALTDAKGLYACAVLGHLAITTSPDKRLQLPIHETTAQACDVLLQCLVTSFRKKISSPKCDKLFEAIASVLVENSCSPGWLTFAANFLPLFGMKDIAEMNIASAKYEKETFLELCNLLLSHDILNIRNAEKKDKPLYNLFLKQILKFAPDDDTRFELFTIKEISRFFNRRQDQDNFCIEFCKENILTSCGDNIREKLQRLISLPKNVRSQLSGVLYPYLLELIKTVENPTVKDVEHFMEAQLSLKLNNDQVYTILMLLSRSQTVLYQELLLKLLNDSRFWQWEKVKPTTKFQVCSTWIETRAFPHEVSKAKVARVYQVAEKLISCTHVKDALSEKLLKFVCDWLYKNVQPEIIFQELKDLDKFLRVDVRESCIHLIEDVLHSHLRIVNDRRLLSQFSHCSYYTRILLLALDKLPIPTESNQLDSECIFEKMLAWCEIWTTILRAQDSVKNHPNFKTGMEIWQNLKAAIKKGNISKAFLDSIKQKKSKLAHLFANLYVSRSDVDTDVLANVQKYLVNITRLVETEEKARKNMLLLESAIKFSQALSWNCGLIPLELSSRSENLSKTKLSELSDEYWKPLLPLLKLSLSLQVVMQTFTFRNVAQVCLQETNREKITVTMDNKGEKTSLYSLFQFLSTVVIERFKTEWNRVFCNPDLQTVGTMKTLLGVENPHNQGNRENLEEEFATLKKYFQRQSLRIPVSIRDYIEDYMKFPTILRQVDDLVCLLETLEIKKPGNTLVSTLTMFARRFKYDETIVLKDLHKPLLKVETMISQYMDKIDDVIVELGQSIKLIEFLKEIVDEDISLLIDAVEEHSDDLVKESLVSMFIQVHGFLAPIIKMCQAGFPPDLILMQVVSHCERRKDMSTKIRQCSRNVHSLKGLYQNVANREEMTKEIILNCLIKGEFDISLNGDGFCQITMSYKKDRNRSTKKSMAELHDLRSRAHLIISSDRKRDERKQEINFADFIEQVNFLTEIEETIVKLQSSGYVKYQSSRKWQGVKDTKSLEELNTDLTKELKEWEKSLQKARQRHYFLNYYWSDQLCILHDFLSNTKRTQIDFENVLTLIHFADPTIDEQQIRDYSELHSKIYQNRSEDTPFGIVSVIGKALDKIFVNTRPILRNILDDMIPSFQPVGCKASVKKGELYVVALEEQSQLTVNVMLSLYENTTNGYPEPYQVIFCGPHTAWEEIKIFLQRCFTQTTYLTRESLFCLANVELLPNDVQFDLIDCIKKQEFDDDDDPDYQLAIICRGGVHHNLVEEFSKFRHSIPGMSYPEISQRFQSSWPDVKFVTSTLPGLGKTEYIRQEALQKGMNVVTFPISGQIDQSKIIKRLKQLHLRDFHCLHFDVGEVDDSVLLDTFLFQLIVTGMVSFGTQLFSLQNTHVYIEIANSLNDRLRESLVIIQCFTRVELNWNNYNDLEVSSKITSNIQVVCQYLNALEKGQLESTDIRFSGHQKPRPLSTNKCRELLRKYYSTNEDTTFTALNTFLGLLAHQLRKFSRSAFFEIENLKLMLENKAFGVRRNLLTALLEVSKDFAARSLKTCSSSHHEPTSGISAQHMVQRVEGMIQWEQSNHLLIVFHGADSHTIAAFYRDKNRVPREVSDLLKSQTVKGRSEELDDFKTMSHEELQERLERIARTKSGKQERQEMVERGSNYYALTPDNMLKMILITLRVRANVPIIIMGETGCGKTSLVEYLAGICQIPFSIYNFHAGRTEEEVKSFIQDEDDEARKATGQRWVFLDEINTCHHLGLINEIMCHHTMYGKPLSRKLVFLAACNPYKLRPLENVTTAGLEGKNKSDEYSELVYRVHPLPEAMMDYVWDYGSLTPEDEKSYIRRMVQNLPPDHQRVLVDLLAESQKFIRKSENNPFCVSLRDVRRCILLVEWFIKIICERPELKSKKIPTYLKKYQNLSQSYDGEPVIKSIVLALAHCYLSRLQTDILREKYIKTMTQLFPSVLREDVFSAIIRMEQEDYLIRMELPPGTAKNSALRENVFVMLVSILNRIPVFVVGKPGCSKSLAIQLIRSNLRGKDSQDAFFKTLPHLYVVSYQGSESSTSEGISEIFEKASNYKQHTKDVNVLPVVLLDEVGLAENSPNNPLKVLHSILEPGKGELPDVAVVGISNWALDAAKMNRAIHLSRPEPTVEDLEDTAFSLCQININSEEMDASTRNVLNCLANAYHEYQPKQGHPNFHGLRDYYSLVKSLRADMKKISVALQRNFGGIPVELSKVQEFFIEKLKSQMPTSGQDISIPVTKLIQENLDDLKARHLMLVTNGDSAIGILKQNLSQSGKEIITIFGSRFEEDMSDDYNYRMLSRIILCMERNCVLILRDLECIYGSLYDMLNQNYAVVGKRKNCRVALGAYSNPMCYVNDGFRCIVLVDYDKVDYSDPPFLNRFEKQLLRFSDVLNEKQQEIIKELQSWVYQMSSVEDFDEQFQVSDMFMGFHEDTLPSLVLLHSNDTDEPNEVIVKKCKDDLMWIATPDGILRTQKCERSEKDARDVKMLAEQYFEKPIHNGLVPLITYAVNNQEFAYPSGGEICSKIIVMTYATVHTDISQCLEDNTITYQVERLSAYKSEKQLEDRIHNFFFSSDKELLIVQCKAEFDREHMLLARSVIEDEKKSYEESCQEGNSAQQRKHVWILVHVRRAVKEDTVGWQFNFLTGWRQIFLDTLDAPSFAVNKMRNETIDNLLASSVWSFQGFAVKCILWCFNCIKYTQNPRQEENVLKIAKNIFSSDNVTRAFQKLIVEHVSPIDEDEREEVGQSWQVKVACDLELLLNSSSLSSAMEQYLSSVIRQPLAKIVYFLERENAWPPDLFSTDKNEYEKEWCDLLLDTSIFNIVEIPECLGADVYSVGGVRLDLKVPFSQVVFRGVEAARIPIMTEYTQTMEDEMNFDDDGLLEETARIEQLRRYSEIFKKLAPCVLKIPENCLSSYMADVLEIASGDFNSKINSEQCISFSTCAFLSFAEQWLPIEDEDPIQFYALLHLFLWTSRDKIIHILELVDYCQGFVKSRHLRELTEDFFSENEDMLPFPENESIDERFNIIKAESDFEESDSESSDSDSSSSEESGSEERYDSSDSERSSSEDEEDEEQECFEDTLVTLLCEKMFPSERTVIRNGGLDSWAQNVFLLLSFASKVSTEAPAYHFLRLCIDYAKISKEYLYAFNKIAKQLKPEYLDADNSLQVITEAVIEPMEDKLRGQEEDHFELQKFLSQFYSRCLETNVETKSARLIIEHVLSLHGLNEVVVMTPVIYRFLFAEDLESPGVFFDIIVDPRKVEDYPCLQDIDEVFKELFKSNSVHHDSYPGVMVCDLIQFIQRFDLYFNMDQLKNSDSQLLRIFRSATKVLTGRQDNTGLVLLSSVAFLRAFYSMLSKQPSSILTTETQYSHVMSEINSLLAAGDARISTLRIFFLKQLYGAGMSMFDLRKLCCESDQLPVIRNQIEDSNIVSKVEFVSVYRLLEYEEVRDAYWQLAQKNDDEMLTVLTKCQNSGNYRLALLGNLINLFYVQKATGNLSDKEERLIDWFSDKSNDLPSPMKELLLRIIGREDFKHRGLQISFESSTVEIETALLILHISCVVASCVEGETSALFQYFSSPDKCHGTCILAHGEDRKRRVFDQFTLLNQTSPVTCSCGLRIKYNGNKEQNLCPNCGKERNDCEETSFQQIRTYCLETKSKEWEECTENMDASVYRALHLIVYACLYAGIATGISSSEAVSLLLSPDTQGSNSENLGKDSANICLNRIKDDLQYLRTILSCKSRTAMDVMHLVVEKCTELIQGNTNGTFSTREECVEWENKFNDVAEDILPNALQSARTLKEMMFQDTNEQCSLIETQIQELDEYPSDPEQQNAELKRLFRVTKQPSFTELRSMFLNNSKEFQEQHRVLAVLLSNFDELPYLACLYPLLHWSRLVSSALTHRISRKEARTVFINDFIDGHLLQQTRTIEERDELRKLFNNFKRAWNTMRELVDQDQMPSLTEDKSIAYCLTEGDLSVYLKTAVKILCSIQNGILDEMILTSMHTRHSALRFLEKNETCCAVMSVSLQEAKEKDIINFDWSDKFMKYAQNPDYGCGEEIDYEFERMEIELANEVVLGKYHLKESFNTFIFSKELFHSSAKVLTKIHELCPQSPLLPDDIRQGLHSLKENRVQDARNLLQHIEIVIYVLNMKAIPVENVREMTLEKFAEEWKSKLPSPFPVNLLPEPKAAIQLTHIAALYEALEDLLADGTIEGLPREFRMQLSEETKISLNSLVDSRTGSLKLKQFLTALRRFVFRYLSAEKFLPEPHESLRSCLREPSLWSPDQSPDPDVIPEEMMLENIHATITHLTQEQREYQSTRSQRSQHSTRKQGKRRVVAQFTR